MKKKTLKALLMFLTTELFLMTFFQKFLEECTTKLLSLVLLNAIVPATKVQTLRNVHLFNQCHCKKEVSHN